MNATESARWLRIRRPLPSPSLRLICLPYAGAGATIFHAWPGGLPNVEVCAVQLPARQDRFSEPGLTRIDTIVDRLVEALELLPPVPTAVYGHSFGGIVAYELSRRLHRMGALPIALIVGARAAPQVPLPAPSLHGLPDAQFCEALQRRYAAPGALLDDTDLRTLVLPALRADVEALETYAHRESPALGIPVTVLRGQADPTLSARNAAAWSTTTTGPVNVLEVDAGHFFVDSHREWVLDQVRSSFDGFVVHERSACKERIVDR